MWRSWRVGSAFDIGVYVHWSFLLVPLFAFVSQARLAGIGDGVFIAAAVFCMFGCILLHEFGHALMARAFGIRTRDITLYPIGGVARLERMTDKPLEELAIAIAGPAVNVAIAILLGLIIAIGLLIDSAFLAAPVSQFIFVLAIMNLGLVAFNMLPAFPMDGGRVLRALLAMRLGQLNATRLAAWLGGVLALVLAFVGIVFFQHPIIPVVAVFLFFAGQQELSVLEGRRRRERMNLSSQRSEEEAVPAEEIQATPEVRTYLWDAQTGRWVPQPNSPFYRSC